MSDIKIGIGYDIHKLIAGRKLMLGGVEIPFEKGPQAYSDGDVLLHAIIDALLGAFGKGDIGQLFPNSDPKWKDADSKKMLHLAMQPLREREWNVLNIDSTVLAEAPKLKKYIPSMRESIAHVLGIEQACVNVKAGTNEGCDAVGRGEAIAAHAVVLIQLQPRTKHPFSIS